MRDPCHESPPALLLEGIDLFNRGLYFEQHEVLEELWRYEPRDIRYLYQGILQIGVAFLHLQRLNHHGTLYMLTRGPTYLRPFAPWCQQVDVAALLAAAARARDAVVTLGPARLGDFDWSLAPRVHIVSPPPSAGTATESP